MRKPRAQLIVGAATILTALASLVTAAPEERPFVQAVPGTEIRFEMVPIPGGTFTMGSPASEAKRRPDEGPQFEVEVEPFYMARFEVTWPEYFRFSESFMEVARRQPRTEIPKGRFADAVTYPTPMHEMITFPMLDERGGRGEGMPAVSMSQFAARQYTKWLSKRTGRFYRPPTEAEWEYAARAGTKTVYSFGDDPGQLKEFGWYFDNADDGEKYQEVGGKKPNAWGLYDMHGNVGEWCVDAYAPDWYGRFAGRKVKASEAINWPSKRYPRVIRGGSYESEAEECRSAARRGSDKKMNMYDAQLPQTPHWETAAYWVGIRVVSPATEPPEAEKRRFWNADDDFTREVIRGDREIHELIEAPAGQGEKR